MTECVDAGKREKYHHAHNVYTKVEEIHKPFQTGHLVLVTTCARVGHGIHMRHAGVLAEGTGGGSVQGMVD